MGTTKKQLIFDTDKAWQAVYGRIKSEGLDQSTPRRALPGRIRPFMKYAAGLLLLVMAGSMLYFALRTHDKSAMITLTNTEAQTFVKTLDDGSVVYLAQNAEISFLPGFSPNERRIVLKGEAFFDVAFNPDQPFIVEAGHATIQVVGTSFNVKSVEPQKVELFVEQGMVNINTGRQSDNQALVMPGELMTVSQTAMTRTKPEGLTLTIWRQNRMHFKDETLANIVSVINKNYGSKLVLENELVSRRKMTVTFYNNSVQAIVDLISLSMNLEAETQADNTIMLTAK